MKKFLLVLLILLLLFGGYLLYDNFRDKGIPKLDTEEFVVDVDELYIYGTHFNIHGNLPEENNLDLVLYDGEFTSYVINRVDDGFNLSDYINDGIDLEEIPTGKYYMFLRNCDKVDDEDVFRYYVLKNNTTYNETTYYTFSTTNRKILINSDQEYGTITFNVTKNTDENIYDVVIDPGHGGRDSGANKNGHYESELTLKTALNLKEKLENMGVKVKLTREADTLSKDEKLNDYGEHGRAVISHEVHAKYVFSIHMNSNYYSYVNGLEVYAPAKINYEFANTLAKNISNSTGLKYSNNKINKVSNGVYTRTFTTSDIEKAIKDAEEDGRVAYDITTNSNYYFMIRETGGIMTGAYVDGRNEEVDGNPYYNSNVGTEAYLLELGYLSNANDLNNIIDNNDKYTEAIANTFKIIFVSED